MVVRVAGGWGGGGGWGGLTRDGPDLGHVRANVKPQPRKSETLNARRLQTLRIGHGG